MLTIRKNKKEYIFENDRDFDSCHSSTIVRLNNNDFLSAWFAGSWEGNPDIAIWMARRTNSGWQRPFMIADHWCVPQGNPSLFNVKMVESLFFIKMACLQIHGFQ